MKTNLFRRSKHDLISSLTAIFGAIELLENQHLPLEVQTEIFSEIKKRKKLIFKNIEDICLYPHEDASSQTNS